MGNFRSIVLDVQNFINDSSTATETIIKDEVNKSVIDMLNAGLFRFTMRQTTVTTTAGITGYYFPADLERVISMTERTANVKLSPVWVGDFDRLKPDPTNYNGSPKWYMELLEDGVLAQPTVAAKVAAQSSSTADVSAQTGAGYATLYGQVGGIDRSELITLSGTKCVSSTLSFDKLYKITTNISCAGTVSFTQVTVGTEYLHLYPGESFRAYKKFNVYPIPDGTYTLYLTYQANYKPLVNDSDVPIIPDRFFGALTDTVISRMLMRQGDAKAAFYEAKAQAALKDALKADEMSWDTTPRVRFGDTNFVYDQTYPFSTYY